MAAGGRGWAVFSLPHFATASHAPTCVPWVLQAKPLQEAGSTAAGQCSKRQFSAGEGTMSSHLCYLIPTYERKVCSILAPPHPQLSVDPRQCSLHGNVEMKLVMGSL